LAAKLRLFRELVPPGGAAVISADHEHSQAVIDAASERKWLTVTVGHTGDGAGEGIRLSGAEVDGLAQKLALEHRGGAKGRPERVGEYNCASIFVDYAHKPDALAKALQALRPYANRKLVVVFGAGGDRDAGKRPLMGAIASENADSIIVTDDNPRNEKPETIRAAILAQAKGAREIGDRGEAIRTAIAGLQSGDALLIAGKGHETGQIVGDKVLPFSDHEAVISALAP